jgi:exonuclease VII small subunit
MNDTTILSGLLAKRTELERAIAALDKQVRHIKHQIGQIDATIELFAPGVIAAKRQVTSSARSAHFVTGELTRRCQTALREARGKPVSADEIALTAMREKGLDLGDGELRADMGRRLLWTLNRMRQRGVVVKEGYGTDARWRFPSG